MLENNLKDITQLLKVLANENRLSIVCNLLEKEMSVSELHERLNHITQPALSQHLAMLKAGRILESRKNGLIITYAIKDKRIYNVIKTLKDNYCTN